VSAARRIGPAATIGLGLLAVPRAVLHDLGVDVGPLNLLLVFGPPAAWVWFALRRRVERPLLPLVLVGLVYGVGLAASHMAFWHELYDDPPRLGGNLEGELSSGAEEVVMRVAVVVSSLGVGAVVGAIAGGIATALVRRRRRDGGPGPSWTGP
jgi:hypothetical protein